jgi:hypothetical protein
MRIRKIAAGVLVSIALGSAGCASIYTMGKVTPNPLIAPNAEFETIWKQAVIVLDEYFEIADEDRQAGTITTDPVVAATLLEPWRSDSVGLDQRAEATLQSIRRFAKVAIRPAPTGGWAIEVAVYKELEDLVKPDRQAGGRAVFTNEFPVNRAREIVGPVPLPAQWIPRGRDPKLEQVILARIRRRLFL